jgi:membrane-bound lytic murein transglycosylase F
MSPTRLAVALVALASVAQATDLPEIQKTGTLRVLAVPVQGQDNEFLSITPGTPPGFDREILDGFAKAQHLKVEIIPLESWDALIPALLKEKGDLIAGRFTATENRRRQIAFTEEVFPTATVVVTRKPHKRVESLDELRNEKIGTIRGTAMAEDLVAVGIPLTRVDLSITAGGFTDALRDGSVSAVVWAVEGAIVARRRDPAIEIGMPLGRQASLAFGVRNENTSLRKALDEHLALLRTSGVWNKLVVKYFGDSALEILNRSRTH